MTIWYRAIGALAAMAFSISAASGEQERLTWPEAVGYVTQNGTASSFYGPVATSLALSKGTTVDYRAISKPGNPSRDFFVTSEAVVLSVTSRSGASFGYTASKEGVLLNAVERNKPIPLPEAARAFNAEKSWWIATISGDTTGR
jgi:hypothetical protein